MIFKGNLFYASDSIDDSLYVVLEVAIQERSGFRWDYP